MAKLPIRAKIFDEGLTEIQRIIRRYDPLSLLGAALEYLHGPAKDRFERASKQPWLIMLLIKWTFLDPIVNSPLRRPSISQNEMLELLQKVLDLTETGSLPNEYEDVRLFFRAVAYQQFFHQTEAGLVDIARQELLFAKVPENHYFKTRFLHGTGVSIQDFLRLSFAVLASTKKNGPVLQRATLFGLCPLFTPMAVDAYLRTISVEVGDLHRTLGEVDKDGRHPNEYLQQTPFLKFPFIKVRSEYWSVSPHVLERSLGHFIYDYLKRADVDGFNNAFGKSFEKYVGDWLSKSGLPIANESELNLVLPGQGKVVDFIVADGDSNVLIDAKGVEMAQRGMVAFQRGDVRRATQTSLIKAFEQGHEVAARIASLGGDHPVIRQRSSTYLLAVTYKELYIGNGITFATIVGDGVLEKIRSKYAEEYLIPVDNIYFLTIHEFEELMGLVASKKIGLVEALVKAKEADSDRLTQKFNFELHIQEWSKQLGREQPLRSTLKSMVDEMRVAFPVQSETAARE
ncbi:GapS1 family protein [Pseudomonas sp. EA_15y_Pfl2_R67]|uniref:GapS1 family protein n=1 Tax=Pseudomonas sp. EA_15y_Pfl2_R67 TaxID=3088687 RepID=UPI0030DBBE9C